MKKTVKEHIARPMDAYKKKPVLRCIDNPKTSYKCEAARNTEGYRSVKDIIAEFEPVSLPDINSNEAAF